MLNIDSVRELAERDNASPEEIAVLTRHALLESYGLLRGVILPAQEDLDLLIL